MNSRYRSSPLLATLTRRPSLPENSCKARQDEIGLHLALGLDGVGASRKEQVVPSKETAVHLTTSVPTQEC